MPPKKYQKPLATEISTQALLCYLQKREIINTRISISPQAKPDNKKQPSLSHQSPILRRPSDFSSQGISRIIQNISPKTLKTSFFFQQGFDLSDKKTLGSRLNLKPKGRHHTHTESSVSQDKPHTSILNRDHGLISPPAKTLHNQFSSLKIDKTQSQKLLTKNSIKPMPTHQKQSSEDLSKKTITVNNSKQHLRIQSMNDDEYVMATKVNSQLKNPANDLTNKLLVSFQFKQKLANQTKQQIQRQVSEDLSAKSDMNHQKSVLLLNAFHYKQHSVQLTGLLKQKPISTHTSVPNLKPQQIMTIVLLYKGEQYKLKIEVLGQKISKLLEICQNHIQSIDGQVISGIMTHKISIPLDYILSNLDLPLSFVSQYPEQPLIIDPLFTPQKEIKSNKMGLKDFEFIRCIGSGGFSKVYLVKEKSTCQYYAMKLIEKQSIFQQNKHGIIHNEKNIMASTSHPFIVKMQYAFESQSYLVFVLEYCSGGELFYLLRNVKKMPEQYAFFYFTEICLALQCLHDNKVIYRDIKPENILIDIHGHLRIADFGLSKPNMGVDDVAYSFCGSPEYMAPEMLLKQGHNQQLDLYCLGALLYELVTGLPPFYCKSTEEIYRRILNQKLTYPPNLVLSASIKDLLSQLLAKNPKRRIDNIDTIFKHPWMQEWGGDKKVQEILLKKIPPPFCPDIYKFNFDENEFSKGETEFMTKIRIIQNTVNENFPKDILMKDFYYNVNELKREKRTNDFYQKLQIVDTGGTTNQNALYLSINNLPREQNEFASYTQRSTGQKIQYKSNSRMNTLEDNTKDIGNMKHSLILNQLRLQHESYLKKQLK